MPTDDEDLLYYQGSGSGDLEAEEREDIAIVEGHGNTGCQVFKRGVQMKTDFCHRINIGTERKLMDFENWCSRGRCQNVPKFDFKSQFFMSKIIRIFLNFFFH